MDKRTSWESLSSEFSNIDISVSQDSSYSSDETSVASDGCAGTVTSSTVPSFVSAAASSLHPLLHSILKKPYGVDEEQQFESESGYGSVKFENGSDVSIVDAENLSERGDDEEQLGESEDEGEIENENENEGEDEEEAEDDDDVCYVKNWNEMINPGASTSHDDDDSFIGFEAAVRFDMNVHYIEPPPPTPQEEKEEGTPETGEMTFHEMMEIARSDGYENDGKDTVTNRADEVELDKRLFIAYVNGMEEVMKYWEEYIQRYVEEVQAGHILSPFPELDSAGGIYIDQVLRHLIGIFPKLVVKDEMNELVKLDEKRTTRDSETVQRSTVELVNRIKEHLEEKLTKGKVEIREDEMRYFAGGIAYSLEDIRSHVIF